MAISQTKNAREGSYFFAIRPYKSFPKTYLTLDLVAKDNTHREEIKMGEEALTSLCAGSYLFSQSSTYKRHLQKGTYDPDLKFQWSPSLFPQSHDHILGTQQPVHIYGHLQHLKVI